MLKVKLTSSVRRWSVLVLLAAGCLAFFYRLAFTSSEIQNFPAVVSQYYPWRWFANLPGNPLWMPHPTGGEPSFANLQISSWYPIDQALEAILPLHVALNWGIVLHVVIGLVSLYLVLERELGDRVVASVGAICFVFSSYAIAQMFAGHYTVVTAAMWIPVVFWFGKWAIDEERHDFTILASGAFGMQLLAGHPQTSQLTCLLLGVWATIVAARRAASMSWVRAVAALFCVFAIVALGAGIAAAELIPTIEFMTHSTRAGGNTFEFSTIYSLPWHSLSGLLFPNLFGTPVNESDINLGPYWEFALYVGIFPLMLAVIGLRLRWHNPITFFFAAVAVSAILLALGANTPVYHMAWKVIPGLSSFRVPARFLLLFVFALAMLSAIGLRELRQSIHLRARRFVHRIGLLCLAVSAMALVGVGAVIALRGSLLEVARNALAQIFGNHPSPRFPLEHYLERLPRLVETALVDAVAAAVLLLAVGVLLIWRARTESAPPCFAALTLIFIVVDLWGHHQMFVRTVPVEPLHTPALIVAAIPDETGRFRVWDRDYQLPHNLQVLWDVQTLEGYNPLRLTSAHHALLSLRRQPLDESRGFLAAMGAKWIVATEEPAVTWIERVTRIGNLTLSRNREALGKAFLVDSAELDLLAHDPKARLGIAASARDRGVRLIRFEPNQIEIHAVVEGYVPQALVLSEISYPGWNVTVDGEPAESRKGYGLLRSVELEPGAHNVVWKFEPSSLRSGLLVSVLSTVLWAVLGMIVIRRRHWEDGVANKFVPPD